MMNKNKVAAEQQLRVDEARGIEFSADRLVLEHVPESYEGGYQIPYGVTSIGDRAFWGCRSLTSVIIPNSVTSIGNWAFDGCGSLTSVTIPDSVTSIGGGAFYGCKTVRVLNNNYFMTGNAGELIDKKNKKIIWFSPDYSGNYIIPDSVMSIGNSAFDGCGSLTSVTIPDSVTSIGDWAFCGCGSLTFVTIPGSVTSIGAEAFYDCRSLTSITIPDNVTSIGDGAFCGFKTVRVLKNNCFMPGNAGELIDKKNKKIIWFSPDYSGNYIIPDSVTSIGDRAFYECRSLTSVTIPDSVTSIGESAFTGCISLTRVTIPDSVTSIGDFAFSGCDNLKLILPKHCEGELFWIGLAHKQISFMTNKVATEQQFRADEARGIEFSADRLVLEHVPESYEGEYQIPYGVTSIGDRAFWGCRSLTSVTIPDSVTSIGDGAFEDCQNLTRVTIPDNVTSIGDRAFCGFKTVRVLKNNCFMPGNVGELIDKKIKKSFGSHPIIQVITLFPIALRVLEIGRLKVAAV